jgi:hypothetical protein
MDQNKKITEGNKEKHIEQPVPSRNANQLMSKKLWDKKFIFIFIALIILLACLLLYKQFGKIKLPAKTITINRQVLQKRSKDLGYVYRGLTGKAVDVNTGKIVKAARIFSADDKTVYLEIDFNNAPKGTIIDYIRYKNGRYVDHGEVSLIKANTKNILFDWIINNLFSNVRNGKWRVATYTNGILAKRISYEVVGNKVSYVNSDDSINPSDSDYLLPTAFKRNY